ncbi:MAG: DsbA family oxidoreductase [Gammaproteobacteria bacterium]|nr:DsbA family oxidoreductase [Gammaproteobacteria bacterium]MBU1625335.1 DsbA family oxidoreductase [Gammaproteobacteria bacterium]MBU1981595.1 DsbA family oxidoreductase [Gammaproteobacteria bacterium]
MQIEVWSDVICPWCYIGKRKLEMALARFPHWESVQVIWRSFELDADAPRNPTGTLNEMLAQKYDVTLQEAEAMNIRVTQAAKEVGLIYHLESARPGNTFDAHRLLHFAASRQLDDVASERLMQGYFSESLAVGDIHALARLAPEFGITEHEALAVLESNDYADAVRADEARATEFGITGVPCFVIDESIVIAGAQPVEVFAETLLQAWQESHS